MTAAKQGVGASPAQIFIASLALDSSARAAGFADGAARRPKQPGEHEWLAYFAGYHEGQLTIR